MNGIYARTLNMKLSMNFSMELIEILKQFDPNIFADPDPVEY